MRPVSNNVHEPSKSVRGAETLQWIGINVRLALVDVTKSTHKSQPTRDQNIEDRGKTKTHFIKATIGLMNALLLTLKSVV